MPCFYACERGTGRLNFSRPDLRERYKNQGEHQEMPLSQFYGPSSVSDPYRGKQPTSYGHGVFRDLPGEPLLSRYSDANQAMSVIPLAGLINFEVPAGMEWIHEENFGLAPANELNGRIPRVRASASSTPRFGRNTSTRHQNQPIPNVFENANFIRSLIQQDKEGNVSLREGQDNSFFTTGMDRDDLVNAAMRYYSVPELRQYFRQTQGRDLSAEQIREALGGQAERFLEKNADNQDDWGGDRAGVTAGDLVIAARKAENRGMEITDPRFLQFMRDHFRAYSDEGGLFNDTDFINKGELNNLISAWNHSRYARTHGRIVHNDHMLSKQIRQIARASNDELGRELQIHQNDLDRLLEGRTLEERAYDASK